jgi:hypothetical protein
MFFDWSPIGTLPLIDTRRAGAVGDAQWPAPAVGLAAGAEQCERLRGPMQI